jgi:precorrin-6Y C5,15-methyltransferase (decarboxylating) CbiT subunit
MKYIRDEEFIRGDCPMTKEEVRILSTSKMELEENHRVLDVGAGTGSISVQAALICSEGEVIAIEKDEDAIETIYKNIEKFQTYNLKLLKGEAMGMISKVEGTFDSIFIGGSGGNLEEIIKEYSKKLNDKGAIVLNFITINNVYKAMETLKILGFEVQCTQVSISKTRGNTYMLMANNPIFIVSGKKQLSRFA